MLQINCGCGGPQYAKEYVITNSFKLTANSLSAKLPNTNDKTDCLKTKVISDYLDLIDKLECGIQSDIENILQEISLIDMKNNYNFNIARRIYNSANKEEDEELLKRFNYLSEFESLDEKERVLQNLGIANMKHVVISESDFDNLDTYDKDTIYFITD